MNKLLWLFAVVFLLSCGTKKNENNGSNNGTVGTETNGNGGNEEIISDVYMDPERPVYHGSETLFTDLIHTKLEVNFIWEKSQMNGVATITAKPHFYETDKLILDAKGMEIRSVKLLGKPLKFTYVEDVLTIQLNQTYTRDQQYTVVIDYLAKPEEREEGGSVAITSDKGLYFINPTGEDADKMPQIWTQGETESSSVWFPTIDQPNAKTTQEVYIKVDPKYITLSNGELVESIKTADGMRIDHWKQDLPHAPYLFMMGVGEFSIVEDSYTRPDGSKMEVNYYVEPEWADDAMAIFGETPEMIKFFSERLGVEYPWDKYNQIVVRDYVSGAMENTSAVIFGDFVYRNERALLDGNDQSTIAHELFHHWFGDLVTCESWSNLPLNESFANYSQYLWDEHRYGLDEADYNAELEADGYYQSAGIQGYHNLIWFDYSDKEQMFDGHSYNKGGRILHMLRNYLGDEAFFAGIQHYLTTNKFKPAEFHQLRLSFEEISGEDLNWFFNQWFLGAGHANLEFFPFADAENSQLVINAYQKQNLDHSPIYKLPFEIAVFDDEGKHIHEVEMDALEEEFVIPYKGTLKGFIIDNEQMLLAKITEDKSKDMYRFQYYNGDRYAARRDGLEEGADESQAGQKLVLDAMKDKFWHLRELALNHVSLLTAENKTKAVEIVKGMIEQDPKSDVRSAAILALEYLMMDDEEGRTAIYAEVIEHDRSYNVITEALNALGNINPELAMKKAESLMDAPSSKMLYGISKLYATHGTADKIDFFANAMDQSVLQGWDRLGVVNSLTLFVARQDAKTAKTALDIYSKQAKSGGFYMMMFLPQNLNYVNESMTAKIVDLKEELAEYEKNDDAVYADQTRKKIAEFEAVQKEYQALIKEIKK